MIKPLLLVLLLSLNSQILASSMPSDRFIAEELEDTPKISFRDWAFFSVKLGAVWAGINMLELNIKGRNISECRLNELNQISPQFSMPGCLQVNVWENGEFNPDYSPVLEAGDKMLLISFLNGMILGAVVYPFYKWGIFYPKVASYFTRSTPKKDK